MKPVVYFVRTHESLWNKVFYMTCIGLVDESNQPVCNVSIKFDI